MKQFLLSILCMATVGVAFGQATANQPSDLMACDQVPFDGSEVFDLTVTLFEIFGAQDPNNYDINYFETLVDATINSNPIFDPVSYSNISNPQTIYARIENGNNGDFDTTSFQLIVLESPNVVNPTPLEVCDDDNDGLSVFDLTSKDAEIANGDPSLVITYHETLPDALTGVNALVSPYANITPYLQTLYVNVVNNFSGCLAIVELDLIVYERPIANQPNNLFVNEGDGDGFATFDLTVNDAVVAGVTPNEEVFYFTTLADAMDLTNMITTPEVYENVENPQTIYVALQNGDTSCYDASQSFTIATDETVPLTDGDNDGIPDVIEDLNNNGDLTDDNTDGDAFPNYLDEDDDGDGTRTADEDYNNNGSPTDDDTNNNGIPDYLDEEVVLGVQNFSAEVISVYPNPTQNNVHIQWDAATQVKAIAVYSLDGKLITAETILGDTTNTDINLSNISEGIYFIKISTENGTLTEKIIKN